MNEVIRAYIAGFLDGDGSVIFQLVRRRDYALGFQIRSSVCFYQHTRGRDGLEWLRRQLGSGYIRDRAGSMSDYTIVGVLEVRRVLELVQPYTVFKRRQVDRALELVQVLGTTLGPNQFLAAAKRVDSFAALNYSKTKRLDACCVQEFLEGKGLLVPVTTEASCRDRARPPSLVDDESTATITRQLLETG